MIYLFAGHHDKDLGAVGKNGERESDYTKELRDLIAVELKAIGAFYTLDKDYETLSQLTKRIKPGSGSVVCDIHLNASASGLATGTECIIKNSATTIERRLATDITNAVVSTCNLYNRGVKLESQSHRGRLAILNTKAGISVLLEVCFIDNKNDLLLYNKNKKLLAFKLAALLKRYDNLYT